MTEATSPPGAATVDLAAVARLIGEPARAAMLDALMAGRALTSGELARAAGVSPATASEHLSKLRGGELVEVVVSGRHRYYRLASEEVAHALEGLSLIGRARPVRSLRESQASEAMRFARTCYDHLAGVLGVALHEGLLRDGVLRLGANGYETTEAGDRLLSGWRIDPNSLYGPGRRFAFPCLDFSVRRPHLAGALAAAILQRCLRLGWVTRRSDQRRALHLTAAGRQGLADVFGIELPGRTPAA